MPIHPLKEGPISSRKASIKQEEAPPDLGIDLTFSVIVIRRPNRAIGFP